MKDQAQATMASKPDWVSVMVGNPSFEFTARLCTGTDKLRLIAKHLPTSTVAELVVCGIGNADMDLARVDLCTKLVRTMVEAGMVERGASQFARLLRCEHANRLIQVISSYGQCYFYSRKTDNVACLSFDGQVYLHDANGEVIAAKAASKWQGFSHDGTLRDLVLQMRDYVMRGTRIDPAYIGIDRKGGIGNIWGYSPEQMRLCRKAAQQLPIMDTQLLECAA